MAKEKSTKKNPSGKTQFKHTVITISEYENGFAMTIEWGFNDTPDSTYTRSTRKYIAATESDLMAIAAKIVPLLVEDEEDDD